MRNRNEALGNRGYVSACSAHCIAVDYSTIKRSTMNIVTFTLAFCLLVGAPRGACMAEMADADGRVMYPRAPYWATERWQDYAAHIVASEARGVPAADIVIACTLIRDIERGYHPWRLHPGRWKGWGTPDARDREAITLALLSPACVHVPEYMYVGNFNDAKYWRRVGVIGDGPVDLYIGPNGSTVVGVHK